MFQVAVTVIANKQVPKNNWKYLSLEFLPTRIIVRLLYSGWLEWSLCVDATNSTCNLVISFYVFRHSEANTQS